MMLMVAHLERVGLLGRAPTARTPRLSHSSRISSAAYSIPPRQQNYVTVATAASSRTRRWCALQSCSSRRQHDDAAEQRRGAASNNTMIRGGCTQRAYYHELAYQQTGPVVSDVLQYRRDDSSLTSSTRPSTPPNDDDCNDRMMSIGRSWSANVRVKMLFAPWNPADMNAVQGLYPLPESPTVNRVRQSPMTMRNGSKSSSRAPSFTVAGSEGLGQVVEVLSSSDSDDNDDGNDALLQLKVGDYVTLAYPSMGTMRSSIFVPNNMLIRVNRGHELVQHHAIVTTDLNSDNDETGAAPAAAAAAASCLFQMGGTALRMLSDFVPVLDPNAPLESRVVLQNAGNSAVGFMVSQIASIHGADAVSLIRRGSRTQSQLDELVRFLMEVGRNSIVSVEEDLLQDKESIRQLKDELRQLSASRRSTESSPMSSSLPLLAFNAVGGSSCSLLFKLLSGSESATLVTYGGMSRKPVPVSTAQLIFDNIQVRGYWQSRWMSQQKSHRAKHQLVNTLVDLVLDRGLRCPPVQVFSLADYDKAFQFEADQSSQSIRRKVVFNCQEED